MLQSKQSEAFIAVAEMGSFEQAALKLNITASAVTLRVQSLEKSLGQILIIRERPCKLTQAGHDLLHHLQHVRLMQQNLLQHLQGKPDGSEFQKISIATNADSLATWLLPLIAPVLKEHNIVVHFQVDDQSQTHHLLESGLVNACVSTEPEAMKGCAANYIGTMCYRFLCTPEFSAQWFKNGVHRDALRLAPALIFNAKDHMHIACIQQHFGLNPSQYPHHFIPSSSIFVDAIAMGLGYGWLPDYQSKHLIKDGRLIEAAPELQIDLALYWHHWKQQSTALNTLTHVLLNTAKQVLN